MNLKEIAGNSFSKVKGKIKRKKFTKKTVIIGAIVLAAVIALMLKLAT